MNRFDAVAAKLPEYGLEAMLLTGAANRFYVTGFNSDSEGGVALVTKSGNFFFTDSRYIEAAEAKIDNVAIGCIDRQRGYISWINEALELTGAKIVGFEEDRMTVADFRAYEAGLQCELQPAADLLRALRCQKDEHELECMVKAQRIAESAFTQLLTEIKPGMTEKELAARLQYLAISKGAEKMSFDTIVASGPNGSMPHAVPSDRQVREGEFITFDFGCIYGGYCSDMTRTVAIGQVTEEMERVYNVVKEAQAAAIAAARPGVTGHDLDQVARDIITEAGYGEYFGHSLGHSLGVEIHEPPFVSPANDQPLPLGDTHSVEPGIYIPGRFGVRIEDVVVLRQDGCEDLMALTHDLQHL